MMIKMIRKIILIATAVIIIISMFNLLACRANGDVQKDTETFTVARGDVIQTVNTSGYIESEKENSYSLMTSGKVAYCLEKGDTFKNGDMLIEIDTTRLKLLVAQAEENMSVAENSLSLARLSYKQALDANHIAIQLAEINASLAEQASQSAYKALENANVSASHAYNSAETSLKNTESIADLNIAQAKSALEEAERALAAGATAILTIEQLRYNVVVAQKNYELALTTKQSNTDIAQGSVDAAGNRTAQDAAQGSYEQSLLNQSTTYWQNLSSTQSAARQIEITAKNISQAESQLELSRINLDLVNLDVDNSTIYAPYDGVVLSSTYREGEYAGPGVPAISVISSAFIIKAEVNETDIVNLEVGQDALVRLDAYYENVFGGKITEISPVSTNIGGVVSFGLTVKPDAADIPTLLYGLSASLDIVTSSAKDVLYVPVQSVFEEDGKSYVNVPGENKSIKKVEVTTGIYNFDFIEIKSGLSEGDAILISPVQ
ncbi:MAG: HlyD family efflux transporter periplasmic adaptor subunit [Actinomycetota bacterium]|nr:HlyD family efflux transporter periplasmic adaptor subunit [Actinomycetota bacterium]